MLLSEKVEVAADADGEHDVAACVVDRCAILERRLDDAVFRSFGAVVHSSFGVVQRSARDAEKRLDRDESRQTYLRTETEPEDLEPAHDVRLAVVRYADDTFSDGEVRQERNGVCVSADVAKTDSIKVRRRGRA